MKSRLLLLLALLFFAALRPGLAEPAALEPGPENGGLRLRLTVVPNAEGFEVRVELVNVSKQAIILRADWRGRGGQNGDLQAFVEAATSIETDPPITPWMGQVMQGPAPSPQPEQVLAAGDVLALSWKTLGRHLKNGVTDPLTVQPRVPSATVPMRRTVSPSVASPVVTAATSSARTITAMPTPQLNVRAISSGSILPPACSCAKRRGRGQASASIFA